MPSCPTCATAQPFTFDSPEQARGVALLRCPRCDQQRWFADGAEVPLATVLQLISGDNGFALVPSRRGARARARQAPGARPQAD